MKKYIKGFTLIELLVVIAIIGILASVVLVSLNSARNKGKDVRVISDVQQLRTQIETDSSGSNYNTSFSAANTLVNTGNYATLQLDATTNAGVTGVNVVTNASSPFTTYAIYGSLPSQGNAKYFCIDSTGSTSPATSQHAQPTCL